MLFFHIHMQINATDGGLYGGTVYLFQLSKAAFDLRSAVIFNRDHVKAGIALKAGKQKTTQPKRI